jgi:hypothetical protein
VMMCRIVPLLVSLSLWSPVAYCVVLVSAVPREEDGPMVNQVQQPEPLGYRS